MKEKMEAIDLDSKKSWHSEFSELVYSRGNWDLVLKETSGKYGAGEFLSQVICDKKYLVNLHARELRDKGREILIKNYTGLIAYHGCRPEDRSTYKRKGICLSNTSALVKKARKLFAGIPDFEKAVKDIPQSYFNHNEGKVFFLISAIHAKGSNGHHSKGSELISALANRLGPSAKMVLTSKGIPTIIKCQIPLGWIEEDIISFYTSNVIKGLIYSKLFPREKFEGFSGGFSMKRVIPPENILEFIDMTSFVLEEEI